MTRAALLALALAACAPAPRPPHPAPPRLTCDRLCRVDPPGAERMFCDCRGLCDNGLCVNLQTAATLSDLDDLEARVLARVRLAERRGNECIAGLEQLRAEVQRTRGQR